MPRKVGGAWRGGNLHAESAASRRQRDRYHYPPCAPSAAVTFHLSNSMAGSVRQPSTSVFPLAKHSLTPTYTNIDHTHNDMSSYFFRRYHSFSCGARYRGLYLSLIFAVFRFLYPHRLL